MGYLPHPGFHESWARLPVKRQILFDAIDVSILLSNGLGIQSHWLWFRSPLFDRAWREATGSGGRA